ncbi:MAG: transketolase [Clostridia bacterium]|nr:transketolase [Clostridia bacterium]
MDRNTTLKAAADIRKLCIDELAAAGYGHIGGSMSICDILAVLYTDILHVDPKNPKDPDRDYLILSKGHCGPALYAALAYKGYFPVEELKTLNQGGTSLPSHCDRLKTTGIDLSTGSLGQGLSLGTGVAVGKKIQGLGGTVFVIVGDGELQEGQNWEAVQFIAHRALSNIVLIVDNNKRQLDNYTENICKTFDYKSKFEAFGLHAFEADGHDVCDIYDKLTQAMKNGPSVVIMDTEKGHGCSFAEIPGFNHYMVITREMADEAIREVDRRLEASYGQTD